MKTRPAYPSDLTDAPWDLIQHLVPAAKPGGRPEDYPTREILNGIVSLLRSGGAWRMLPHDLPPWRIVYDSCWTWRKDGTWTRIHDLLRGDVRAAEGRHRQPRAGSRESPSVQTTEKGGSAAMRPPNRSRGARGRSWSIREGSSWPSW